jgi:hypothetical protein
LDGKLPVVANNIREEATRLIDEHGRHAAGKAFSEALAQSLAGHDEKEAFWLAVAGDIMEIQRRDGSP